MEFDHATNSRTRQPTTLLQTLEKQGKIAEVGETPNRSSYPPDDQQLSAIENAGFFHQRKNCQCTGAEDIHLNLQRQSNVWITSYPCSVWGVNPESEPVRCVGIRCNYCCDHASMTFDQRKQKRAMASKQRWELLLQLWGNTSLTPNTNITALQINLSPSKLKSVCIIRDQHLLFTIYIYLGKVEKCGWMLKCTTLGWTSIQTWKK